MQYSYDYNSDFHQNYNFLDVIGLKKKVIFSTNSLSKLLSDSSLSNSLLSDIYVVY